MKKILFLLSVLITQQSFASTYYVAVDGSDDNAGTKSKPFATINLFALLYFKKLFIFIKK